jgi:hypothetical protein
MLTTTPAQARAEASHAAALRELEFQASWRACRWMPIGTEAAPTSPLGYQESPAASLGFRGPRPFVPTYAAAAAAEEGGGGGEAEAFGLDAQQHLTGPQLSLLGARGGRFHEHLHGCLRALAARDAPALALQLRASRARVLASLSGEVPFEPSRLLGPLLARLQSLREVEEVALLQVAVAAAGQAAAAAEPQLDVQLGAGAGRLLGLLQEGQGAKAARTGAQKLLEAWRERSAEALADDFELGEPVLALREVLLRALCPPLEAKETLSQHVCELSSAARLAGSLTVAGAAVDRVLETLQRQEGSLGGKVVGLERCMCKLEQARVLWARGETELAIRTAAAVGGALSALERKRLAADERSRGLLTEVRCCGGGLRAP